ncbi:MAG: hypothetical protein DYG87_04730 [Anaerolineae bacterium CFX3]|nr:hypothetical protein [Anaerolineales bacterium]MCE7905086.1 hypothetical protein [Anaerolineae bacterium CFX3]MCQ3946395.1 hypothetical protein [Anaerolineae bacterium]RIK23704.1 MAG: hypothetical protein DCC54_14450 [Anaerolineae bacterium]
MKRLTLFVSLLALAALACATAAPSPTPDIHVVETIAAGTLAALAPTQPPPTFTSVPTPLPPTQTPFPTLPPPASGPTRIQFAQGAVSAVVTGNVTFPNRPQYILYAFKGQRITVVVSSNSNTVGFSLVGVTDGQPYKRLENESRTFETILPLTQDYLISVAIPGGSDNYTLTVAIISP